VGSGRAAINEEKRPSLFTSNKKNTKMRVKKPRYNIERKAISLLPQGAAEHGTCGCHTANENAYEPMAETR
jgi:hypothetical protein